MEYLKQPNKKQVSDFKKVVGSNIKFFRTAKKLSQQKLADMIGTGSTTISNLEIGRNQAKIETLLILAEALDVRPQDFYTLDPKSNQAHEITELKKEVEKARQETKSAKEELKKLVASCEKLAAEYKNKI